MQNLVDHMQIGRQSLYNTFGDKHTLYMRALRMYDATSHQDALGRLMDPGAGFAAIEGFLGDIVRGLSNQEDRRACFLINAILELAPRDEEVRAIGVDFRKRLTQAFDKALIRARLKGEIPAQIDPAQYAKLLAHTAMGMSVTWKAGASPEDLAAIVEEALLPLRLHESLPN